jgi:hypothetical protein
MGLKPISERQAVDTKVSNLNNSQIAISALPPERGVRGRFRLSSRQELTEASYSLDNVPIRSVMESAGPLDRSGQFRELAAREQFERVIRRHLAGRGMRGF